MVLEQHFEQFKAKAEALSTEVHRTKNPAEAIAFIRKFIENFTKEQGKEVRTVWADTPMLAEVMTEAKDVPNIYYGNDIPANAADSLIGVSQADFAVAESGSLALDATDVLGRLVSTLTFVHIALVPTNKLVGTIAETLNHFYKELPGYVNYISGPSRTADIERVLTIGVHGPERLVVVFVDQVGGDE